jgi:hypothetical protein
MIVAFDYDKTWTLDPEVFHTIALLLQGRGHTTLVVTGRSDEGRFGAEVRRAIGSTMPIVFAAGGWKREAALRAGYKVDTWWDDEPEYIGPQHLLQVEGKATLTAEWDSIPGRDPAKTSVRPLATPTLARVFFDVSVGHFSRERICGFKRDMGAVPRQGEWVYLYELKSPAQYGIEGTAADDQPTEMWVGEVTWGPWPDAEPDSRLCDVTAVLKCLPSAR